MLNLGDFATGATVRIPFHTTSNGVPVTMTGLAVTDIEIYKDGSVTQRSSDSGYALLDTDGIDFDGVTGLHGIEVDLSDDTDVGFFAAGSDYWVLLNAITVSGSSITIIVAIFSIVNRAAPIATAIRDVLLPVQNEAFPNMQILFVAASDHVTPVTSASGSAVTRSIDGAAFGAGTGTFAEIGNGLYQYDASAADMNGGVITFRFTATGGTPGAPDDKFITVYTGAGV